MEKEEIKNTLLRSPLFNLSLSSKELFHSNFLAWLGEHHRACFLAVFRDMGCAFSCPDSDYTIKREYENFDLCVLAPDGRIVFILENKVKSLPRAEQLKEYEEKAVRKQKSLPENLMLLSLATEFPDKDIVERGPWKVRHYHQLSEALQGQKALLSADPYAAALVDDYCLVIESLHQLAQSWLPSSSEPFLLAPCEKAFCQQLRVGDLQDKIRYSQLFEELNRQLREICRVVESADVKSIQCDSDYIRKAYTNYGFTHAQGLLEVKIKFSEDYVLLIQLQGDKYCHCIEWITDRPIPNEHEAWRLTCDLKDSVSAFLQTDELPAVFPSVCLDEAASTRRRKEPRTRNFNKYGNNFLYQYRKIKEDATVSEVLRAIKEEVDVLLLKQFR